ncbi:hypothetical protein TraAM80_06034 [Trypanosoma rangeli]|uniref:Kinesin n=1 Tax=Trypanosoma rangeli TaxID=5698 RepID=A0A3R7KB27_TRYRA|nr:uncharacterized protein TraAM80_06034 [Trypanosoma rangeli]RNF02984.1 hypothetical protein TraAM80_06034 [Trypanosoma rangeli]|eukprot:RNF02984.1 hypothetical protein TraAM80_06034 [Trypanosoma rangeli]
MLVGVREYRREEVQRICGAPAEALVSYYTLLRNKNEAVMADVTDVRARRHMNFDYYASNTGDLFAEAVRPIMRAVLPPISSPQVVVVVDGTETTRFNALLEPEEGMLTLCWRVVTKTAEFANLVEAVHLAVVELDDSNHLRDLTPAVALGTAPTIIEDADEHFTSVEDACYVELRTEADVRGLLQHACRVIVPERHQVFSFILTYKEALGLPNSTIQFLALSVSEMTRGMQSTRHCIATTASLIESRSPSVTFPGTKFSFLLKPALFGQQPGLWISCFAPTSVSSFQRRETFKEAFCIAHTLSRVYSSRVGLGISEAWQRVGDREGQYADEIHDEQVEIQPRVEVPQPSSLGWLEKPMGYSKKTFTSIPHQTRSGSLISSPSASSFTPNVPQHQHKHHENGLPGRIADDQMSPVVAARDMPMGLLVTPSEQRTKPLDDKKTQSEKHSEPPNSGRRSLGRSLHDRCSSVEKHPYNCSARYEFETYKRVMEPAMKQLRKDIQHYVTLLEDARRHIWQLRRANREGGGVEQLRVSLLAAERERKVAEADFAKREERFQERVSELEAQCEDLSKELQQRAMYAVSERVKLQQASVATQTPNSLPWSHLSSSLPPSASVTATTAALPVEEGLVVSQTLQKDSSGNDVQRAAQWLELVSYHQRELEDHAERERSYRNRILHLEQTLTERASEAEEAKAELMRREHEVSLEAVRGQQREQERKMERNYLEDVECLRAEVVEANKTSSKAEHHLEKCLIELEQERKQREASDAELRRLQEKFAQGVESGAAKEMVQMLKDSYDRHVQHLQQEIEELRALTRHAVSNEKTPLEKASAASTPLQQAHGRLAGGLVSPAIEAVQEKSMFSSRHSLYDKTHTTNGGSPTRFQSIPIRTEIRRFEDFMKEEPSYTFRSTKVLDRTKAL